MTSIEFTNYSAIDIFNEGRERDTADRREREKDKVNILRGGSAGCITSYGEFIGANPWEALARFMGFQMRIPKKTFNIFDNGHANEMIWDMYLEKTDWTVKNEEAYPLVIEDAFQFPLTGRPDAVVGNSVNGVFVPEFGIEHKAICSVSSAKILKEFTPKTENLIQAGVYSKFFGLPWLLVYTSNSNFYAIKADKIEFKIGWLNGALQFHHPDTGIVTTNITDTGIDDFYSAICEAHDIKDHSWFKRGAIDYNGEPVQNWDSYNTFNLMVDKGWEWSKWVEHAEAASESSVIIQIEKKGKNTKYNLTDVDKEIIVSSHASVDEARKVLYDGIFS